MSIDNLTEETKNFGETSRMKGKLHVYPLLPCPLCGTDVDIVEYDMVYLAECPKCGLTLGLPYGYASRLDLANDWNIRS
jgi:uncharacterized paraquat-inducible protein A